MGAFCDWGVLKELLVPFSNQAYRMSYGRSYVVHLYLDEASDRLVGTTKLKNYLRQTADEELELGQEVELLVYGETDLGYLVIINQKYSGLVYANEVHLPPKIGDILKGYIKPIRPDGKIDVSLYPIGHESIEPNAHKILEKLKINKGFLPYTDKSDPDRIREEFSVSKKLFKKALGNLYKQKLVELKEDGIYLKE
jgi:predicted RNA-binding protein (virulence factor B family)